MLSNTTTTTSSNIPARSSLLCNPISSSEYNVPIWRNTNSLITTASTCQQYTYTFVDYYCHGQANYLVTDRSISIDNWSSADTTTDRRATYDIYYINILLPLSNVYYHNRSLPFVYVCILTKPSLTIRNDREAIEESSCSMTVCVTLEHGRARGYTDRIPTTLDVIYKLSLRLISSDIMETLSIQYTISDLILDMMYVSKVNSIYCSLIHPRQNIVEKNNNRSITGRMG